MNPENQNSAGQSEVEAILKEPWPDWLTRILRRMARTYAPQLDADDLKNRPWIFEGYAMAGQFLLAKVLKGVNLSAFPESEYLEAIKKTYHGTGVLEVWTPSEILVTAQSNTNQTLHTLPQIYDTIAEAARQPVKEATQFFEAFGDGLKRQMALNSVKRLRDSNTVKICMFLMGLRPAIEAGKFRTVSELIDVYYYLLDGNEKRCEEENKSAVRKSFELQFQKICTEDGLKLAGRGRPRKTAETPEPIKRPKRPRSRKL